MRSSLLIPPSSQAHVRCTSICASPRGYVGEIPSLKELLARQPIACILASGRFQDCVLTGLSACLDLISSPDASATVITKSFTDTCE